MVCEKDVCVCVKDGRVEKKEAEEEEEEEEPGGTDPKTRIPHNDVGKEQYVIQSLIKLLMVHSGMQMYTLLTCTSICLETFVYNTHLIRSVPICTLQGAGHRLGSWHHEIHALVAPGTTKSSGGECIAPKKHHSVNGPFMDL